MPTVSIENSLETPVGLEDTIATDAADGTGCVSTRNFPLATTNELELRQDT